MMSRYIASIEGLAKGGWINGLLTFIAGASMIGAFAPFSFWYLVFPGLIWLILPLQSLNLKATFYRGLWFNCGFFAAGISWVHVSIHQFGNAPLPLSIPLTGLFILLLSLYATLSVLILNRFFSHLSSRLYYLVAFPFSWLLVEWLGSWFLTGFPWLNLGHSQIDGYLSAVAPVMGSTAISFLIVLIAGALVISLREGKKAVTITASIFIPIIILLTTLHQIHWVKPTDKTLTVSLIQPSIAQEMKWRPEHRRQTLDYFQQVTDQLDSQLIVWPEGAVPALARQVKSYLKQIDINAAKKSQAVLTGITVKEDNNYYNASIMLGAGEGKYYKQHLVPFGEYVPLESLLRGLIDLFDLPMSSYSAGSDDQQLQQFGDWKVAMAICYEVIFQQVVASQLQGADILVTLSNDAWFGNSIGPYQHLDIARMRALENGIPLIRATNDGISALIDHRGKVLAKMDKFEKGALSGKLTATAGETPFRKLGPSWVYFILLLIPGLILLYGLRDHTNRNRDQ